jgi:hypothetical protein
MKQPWDVNPALTTDRLKQLASFIREVRDSVVDLHNEELGDSARSLGLRAYECVRTRIIRASNDPEWSWLKVLRDDGRFTFSIANVPVRFYRGKPDSPEERRLIPCIEASRQMSLLSEDVGNDVASVIWFFAVELDELRYVERVSFTGFYNGAQVAYWEIPLDEKVMPLSLVDSALPAPSYTQKASVSVKVKKKANKGSSKE